MSLPAPPADRRTPGVLARILRAPIEARTWKETLYLLLSLPVGIITFTVIVTGFSTGLGMLITLLGIPVLIATMYVSRWMGAAERARARGLLGLTVPAAYRPNPSDVPWWRAQWERLKDPAAWREIAYHLLLLAVGTLTFSIAVTVWGLGLWFVTLPMYGWAAPSMLKLFGPDTHPLWVVNTPLDYTLVVLLGIGFLLLAPWVVRGVAALNRPFVRELLGGGTSARVQTLTETRAAAVDLAAADRRQIERDLHDGVQQRLVSLAMDLGRAKARLDTDPEAAKELVGEAHEEAKRAIIEVRDLARGIYPAVLTDRGLDAALSALAARSPVPVDVRTELSRRPPASVEAAAYFVVSEALTNVAKHARATRASVLVRLGDDGFVTVAVEDDGVGGADLNGAGLSGLRDRVRALDGELRLLSPEGGPTVLMAEIPCAS